MRQHTAEKKSIVISLYNDGASYSDIVTETGLSRNQVLYILHHYGSERRGVSSAQQGEKHNRAKLSDQDVMDILSRYEKDQMTAAQLAQEYGLHCTTVRDILRGKSRVNNPEINAFRQTITLRNERTARPHRISVRKSREAHLHFSDFNTESGPPILEKLEEN